MTDRAKCQHRVRWEASDYGMLPIACGQVVGVTTWTDESGLTRAACALHKAEVEYRFPPESPLLVRAAHGDR